MTLFNLTAVEGVTDVANFWVQINLLSEYKLAMFSLFALALISILTFSRYRIEDRLIAAGFITTIVGLLFVFLELITLDLLLYPILFLIGSLMYKIWGG